MQTDILLKQVTAALADLRTAMDKFEKHPNTHYAGQLHDCLNQANKLVAAYTVLKEQKDVSPELDLHLKIMSAEDPKPEPVVEKKPEMKVEEPVREEPQPEVKPEIKAVTEEQKEIPVPQQTVTTPRQETTEKPVISTETEKTPEPVRTVTPQVNVPPVNTSISKEIPKLAININDKFRLINELFSSNANEYSIAIEQLNNVSTREEADTYLKGLKNIYHWDEENEMVKRLIAMNQKRFS